MPLAIAIFVATVALVVLRPRGVSEAWWATLGAITALALGVVRVADVGEVLDVAHEPLLFLLALLLLSKLVERSGFFDWAAAHAARLARGSGEALFRNVFLLASFTTITLSLDTTALLVTPLVVAFVRKLEVPAKPYVLACAFVANAGSLLLPPSNLTNLLFAHHFGMTFGGYALRMALPQLAALGGTFLLLRRHCRRDLAPFDATRAGHPARMLPSPRYFHATWVVLTASLVAYFLAPLAGVPTFAVAFVACAVLAVAGIAAGRVRARLVRKLSWKVFPFVLGLFVVVKGLENAGLTDAAVSLLARVRGEPLRALALTFGSAIVSSAGNNLPAALFARSVLGAGHASPSDVAATLVGLNVGPNFVAFASLATILVLSVAKKSGVELRRRDVLRAGLRVTPLVLVATVAVVVLEATAWPAR